MRSSEPGPRHSTAPPRVVAPRGSRKANFFAIRQGRLSMSASINESRLTIVTTVKDSLDRGRCDVAKPTIPIMPRAQRALKEG